MGNPTEVHSRNMCSKCGESIVRYGQGNNISAWLHENLGGGPWDHEADPANTEAPSPTQDVEHSVALTSQPPRYYPTFKIKLPITARGEGASVHIDGVDVTKGLRRVEVKGHYNEATTVILEFIGEVDAEVHAAFNIIMKANEEAYAAAQDEPEDDDGYANMIDATVTWLSRRMARGDEPGRIHDEVDWAGHTGMTAQMSWGAAASQQEPFTKQRMLDFWNNMNAPGMEVPPGKMVDVTSITIDTGDEGEGEQPTLEDHQAPEGGDGK